MNRSGLSRCIWDRRQSGLAGANCRHLSTPCFCLNLQHNYRFQAVISPQTRNSNHIQQQSFTVTFCPALQVCKLFHTIAMSGSRCIVDFGILEKSDSD